MRARSSIASPSRIFLPVGLMMAFLWVGAPAARAEDSADSIGDLRSKALRNMRERAVVGGAPAWPAFRDSGNGLGNREPEPAWQADPAPVATGETVSSSASPEESPAAASPPPGAFGEYRLAAALFDDFEMGLRFGAEIAHPGLPLNLVFDFEGRPFSKAVRVRESDVLEYQFQEHRFTPSLGITSRLAIGPEAFWTFGGGLGVSFGYYRGSNRSAEVTFPPWIETGFRFGSSTDFYWGIGYQYFPLPSASSHRIALVFGLRGPDKEGR